MAICNKSWTPQEAEEWTKEDTITVILSPLVYVLLTMGTVFSMLLIPAGFFVLGAGIVLMFVMICIINPKLTVISREYEKKQKQYLEELERKVKWED